VKNGGGGFGKVFESSKTYKNWRETYKKWECCALISLKKCGKVGRF